MPRSPLHRALIVILAFGCVAAVGYTAGGVMARSQFAPAEIAAKPSLGNGDRPMQVAPPPGPAAERPQPDERASAYGRTATETPVLEPRHTTTGAPYLR